MSLIFIVIIGSFFFFFFLRRKKYLINEIIKYIMRPMGWECAPYQIPHLLFCCFLALGRRAHIQDPKPQTQMGRPEAHFLFSQTFNLDKYVKFRIHYNKNPPKTTD